MRGKLLNYVESFSWMDKETSRSFALQNYNESVIESRKSGDQLFCPETMFISDDPHNIFLFMWNNGYRSYGELKIHFEWLTTEDFQLLSILSNFLGKPTPNSSNDWRAFSLEFIEDNTSLIGLKEDNCTYPLVYDKVTHKKFHSDYVASFTFDKQKVHYKYFKEHYKPSLKISGAQITGLIKSRRVNEGIVRLDLPTKTPDGVSIHSQQVHVHIKIGSKVYALNIDGTWKHPPEDTTIARIPSEICLTLSEWGFCLPEDYYLN